MALELVEANLITQYIVWRTSTPEPTRGDGIIWTHLKDVTRFVPLFSKPGTFILQLDNLLETGLDGQYASKPTMAKLIVSSYSCTSISYAARDILCLLRKASTCAQGECHYTCEHACQRYRE